MTPRGELFDALQELELASANLRGAMEQEAQRRVDLALLQLGMAMKRVENIVIAGDVRGGQR